MKMPQQPTSIIMVNRVLVILVIILAFVGGYYHANMIIEQKKYSEIERQLHTCKATLEGTPIPGIAE